ncbi:MAG TPA: CBS domain-containing protein [Polyangia bacterium]|jgi:CBS domain-containing protein|nr:CBS domain-containing protein [Polyangia bacterium]
MDDKTTIRHLLKRAPVTIREDDDLALVLQIMRWAEIRHLPVMHGEQLRGVVSERDVLKRLAEVGNDAGAREKAGAVMNSPVVTIGPDDTLEAAIKRVNAWRIGCLPVIEKDHLLGIVTRSDLLDGAAAAPAVEPPAEESPGAVWPRATVEAVMSIDPVTASADDTLSTVVERMVRLGVRHVPVIDGDRKVGILPVVDEQDRLLGVVSYVDILRAIIGPKPQAN